MWTIVDTRDDGQHVYKNARGNAWATIWDYPGRPLWAVYVGDGNNQVASGKSSSLMLAKIAANAALKRAVNGR